VEDPPTRFTRLYDRYYRNVLGYALLRAERTTAEDVASETFLIAWRPGTRRSTLSNGPAPSRDARRPRSHAPRGAAGHHRPPAKPAGSRGQRRVARPVRASGLGGRPGGPGLKQDTSRPAAPKSPVTGERGKRGAELRPSVPLPRRIGKVVVHVLGCPVGLAGQRTCPEAGQRKEAVDPRAIRIGTTMSIHHMLITTFRVTSFPFPMGRG
jgi:hypothetical protein